MSHKLFKNLLVLIAMLALIWWNYELMQSGQADVALRNPFLMIIVCIGGTVYALFWIVVELLKRVYAHNPKVMSRLNGDFWTVLLGPIKK